MASVFSLVLLVPDPSSRRLPFMLAWHGIFQLDRQCLPDSFDARGILTSRWSCAEVSGEVSDWL